MTIKFTRDTKDPLWNRGKVLRIYDEKDPDLRKMFGDKLVDIESGDIVESYYLIQCIGFSPSVDQIVEKWYCEDANATLLLPGPDDSMQMEVTEEWLGQKGIEIAREIL